MKGAWGVTFPYCVGKCLKFFLLTFLILVIAISIAEKSDAYLISGPDIIAAPGSVVDNPPGATNDHQQAFNERQNVLLLSNLYVDGGGFIPAGTLVNSHMIFLNTDGDVLAEDFLVQWAFDGPILGVMSDLNALLEADSNNILGNLGTIYPGSFDHRGLDPGDGYSIFGNTITVSMSVSEPGDWIRVVTAPVPIPGTVWLLTSGIFGLLVCRRKYQR